jgi:hypothetical protein
MEQKKSSHCACRIIRDGNGGAVLSSKDTATYTTMEVEMKLISIVTLLVASLVFLFAGQADATGCNAKVECLCYDDGSYKKLGSRSVNGSCTYLFGKCTDKCTPNTKNLDKALKLCHETYSSCYAIFARDAAGNEAFYQDVKSNAPKAASTGPVRYRKGAPMK